MPMAVSNISPTEAQQFDAIVLAALRAAPRRYRMAPLPIDANAAKSSGVESALAFGIEAVRLAKEKAWPPSREAQDVFTGALGHMVHEALASNHGDAAFQALVLRTQDLEVDEYARLSGQAASDLRSVRKAANAISHPGKLRHMASEELRHRLSRLHDLATAGSWMEFRRAIGQLLAQEASEDEHVRDSLEHLLSNASLQRLERGSALHCLDSARRYRALLAQHGPLAASAAAAAQGRESARHGAAAEKDTVHALSMAAELMNHSGQAPACHRVVRGLRNPRSLHAAARAKAEWDVAIVRDDARADGVDIVLLAEVKTSPAAATPDLPRLLRGLEGLAQARADATYSFQSPDGELHVRGESLRRLRPRGYSLPPNAIYCCSATAESRPQMLSAATKAMLLAEPASLAFAREIARGGSPRHEDLTPVWEALREAPRLRAALNQYETARAAREAMLHPADLISALEKLSRPRPEV